MANPVAELVFIPAPAVGHIMSAIEMAKLLLNHDQRLSINVLLVNPLFPDIALTTYIQSVAQNPIERIRFTQLPQPHQTPPNIDPKDWLYSLYEQITSHRNHVKDIVTDMMNRNRSCSVVGFVVDVFCTGMIDVANEFNVPSYVFYTSGSSFLGFNLYIEKLCLEYQTEHVVRLINSDHEVVVPSFVNPVPTKVFPVLYQAQEGLEFLVMLLNNMRKAKGIMVNTFLELETHAMKVFPDDSFPRVYPVGPVLNLDGVPGKDDVSDVFSWLDGQPVSSVVFLCFGSGGSFGEVQVKEIARGLELGGYRFVWSLRGPPPRGQNSYDDPRLLLPDGFLERTMRIGRVIEWAPQVAILAHKAVGGFMSHCGWNSILESMWFGVPTLTWPLYAEQQLNAFEMVVELGLAVNLKLDYKMDMSNADDNMVIVTAEEVETGIKRVMEDNEVRAKVKEMSQVSKATMTQGVHLMLQLDSLCKKS